MGRPRNPERDKSLQRYLDADGKIGTAELAKLAGVPESVISRAKELVEELSQADISVKAKAIAEESQAQAKQKTKPKTYDEVDLEQISLFDTVKDDDVVKELQELDISNMTPMDAMNTLYRLQNKLKNRW